jgi:hypothetical protein
MTDPFLIHPVPEATTPAEEASSRGENRSRSMCREEHADDAPAIFEAEDEADDDQGGGDSQGDEDGDEDGEEEAGPSNPKKRRSQGLTVSQQSNSGYTTPVCKAWSNPGEDSNREKQSRWTVLMVKNWS